MQIVPIFISGVVGAACSVAFSYGVASLPCRLVSKSADTVCQERSFGKALDSWKFGFVVGGLTGLILTRVICLIDECFDLLSDDNYCDRIETALMKLLAKAGGAGIHVLLYTQRPDKNVIDPLIRSNFPAKTAFVTTRPEDSCIILGDDKDKRAVYLLGYGDFLYKTTEVLRLQALYVADDEDPEYFQQLLLEAKNQNDPYTAWQSGLDFDEFVASLYGESNSKDIGKSKATAVTKTKQHKTDFEGSFNFKVQLDEEARNSILNLHQKGYQLDEIVKAVFNLSRQDGRSYKKFRNVIEEFLNSLKGGGEDDI